jgi:CubicO group peptidase (beta-lactamase class C family)
MNQTSQGILNAITILGLFGLLLPMAGCDQFPPIRAMRIASASTSQTLCNAAFISKTDPDQAYQEEIRPAGGMSLIAWALHYDVDRAHQRVTTSIGLGAKSRALFSPDYGCLIDYGDLTASALEISSPMPSNVEEKSVDPFPSLGAAQPVQAADPYIRDAIESAFREPDAPPFRHTKAVVVVHHGKLVGEKYAPDILIDTMLPGHSLSKSLTHALIGILVAQNTLDPDAPVPVAEWHKPNDPRGAITAKHLLSMSSGLPWDERSGGFDQSTRMWFTEPDPFNYAIGEPLDTAVGQHWAYSNLGYVVLSRLVRDLSGGSAQSVNGFARKELFAPLGMKHVFLTLDSTGTPEGSNMFLASARDWARLGLLYLNNGRIAVGGIAHQILPPDWAQLARMPTLDAGYGSGFWLNNTQAEHPLPGHWGMKGAPKDIYFGRGYLGQFIIIIPSRDLVIVRMGTSYRRGGDIDTVGHMVERIIEALDHQ